jgi:hypothetical protein
MSQTGRRGSSSLSSEPIKLGRNEAELLVARLSALAQAARVFGSGVAGTEVDVVWSLQGPPRPVRWSTDEKGSRRVRMELDLRGVIPLLTLESADSERAYLDVFKAAFLHELGHVLFSPGSGELLADFGESELVPSVSTHGTKSEELPRPVSALLGQIRTTLEDARVERLLTMEFRGARRYLESHAIQALHVVHGDEVPTATPSAEDLDDRIARLVAMLFLQLWGLEDWVQRERVPPDLLAITDRLRAGLVALDLESGSALAVWILEELLPELQQFFSQLIDSDQNDVTLPGAKDESSRPEPGSAGLPDELDSREGAPSAAEEAEGRLQSAIVRVGESLRAPSLLGPSELNDGEESSRSSPSMGEPVIVLYPHADGGFVLTDMSVVSARAVPPSERTESVLEQVAGKFGPLALEAFAAEEAALRRALQVNFERRAGGRYRSGKRFGMRNMRRYLVNEDLLLFQRLEVPERLSYYFHLLLDVSPSMLTNQNAAKAIAIGYAFASVLDRLHLPVDVSLYSSAITELYDHRFDTLERFFGSRYGYLSSGTHEIEAIAYAKQKADRVKKEHKLLVVVTDGHPNGAALAEAGSLDLPAYYRETLIPWLRRAQIDLIGIGITSSPTYHSSYVTISQGWESIPVFMRLLDEIIASGEKSHAELWK